MSESCETVRISKVTEKTIESQRHVTILTELALEKKETYLMFVVEGLDVCEDAVVLLSNK